MARKGRKPKPTAVKVIQGNPGGRPLNQQEPRFKVANLPVPAQLLEKVKVKNDAGQEVEVDRWKVAREEWNRVAPELARVGVLTKVDEKALIGYCVNWQRWVEAQGQLASPSNWVLMHTKSGYPFPNPFLTIADKAMEQMRKFAVEFGMTPSSRSSIHGNPETESENRNEWEQLESESQALTVN